MSLVTTGEGGGSAPERPHSQREACNLLYIISFLSLLNALCSSCGAPRGRSFSIVSIGTMIGTAKVAAASPSSVEAVPHAGPACPAARPAQVAEPLSHRLSHRLAGFFFLEAPRS